MPVNNPRDEDHNINLAVDSRVMTDDPTTYPEGLTTMPSTDQVTSGTFAEFEGGIVLVETTRYYDPSVDADGATQILKFGGWTQGVAIRIWVPGNSSWDATLYTNAWSTLGGDIPAADVLTAIKTVDGTGSGLDADLIDGSNAFTVAGTPSEGKVVKYLSGVPTWAAP